MPKITKTRATYTIYLDPAEVRDIADVASVLALLAVVFPEPTSKTVAAAAGVAALAAKFASRKGYGIQVSGVHLRGIPVYTPVMFPVKDSTVAA